MNTLKEDIDIAVQRIHAEEKIEWIPLKRIYEKVEEIRKEPVKNNGASVRASLEYQCASCDVFKGEEKYIAQEKGLGLYKSIYYDQIKFINSINIGDTFTRDQLMAIFKISGQSGMMKTNSLHALILTTSESNGVYSDSFVENGTMIYTGEGLEGNQTLDKNNKTLYYAKENNLPVYLFSKDKNRKYTFEGKVEVYDNPYQVIEKDINNNDRLVWKFPLRVINEIKEETHDEKLDNLIFEIIELDNHLEIEENNCDLIFKDGPLNIRKYRKTGNKINRKNKPDYIAEAIIKNKQGIQNEKVIYEAEIKRLMAEEAKEQVKLMEEFFKNKKENEGFDILTFELDENNQYTEKYIEVKSTKGSESTPIDITAEEIEFAREHIDNYLLYRIIYSDSDQRYVKVVKGEDLFKNYNFVPTTFKIYSN